MPFQKKYVGPTSLVNLFKVKIIKQKTPNGIDVYIIDYLIIGYLSKRINLSILQRFLFKKKPGYYSFSAAMGIIARKK